MGALVEITKFKVPPGGPFPLAGLDYYIQAAHNPELAPKADYTVQGFLREDTAVGRSVRMLRFRHNGNRAIGRHVTPLVLAIVGHCFATEQAIYVVKVLRPPRQIRHET
jgi:hypothetical protein